MQPFGALVPRDMTELVRRRPVEVENDLHAVERATTPGVGVPGRRWAFVVPALERP